MTALIRYEAVKSALAAAMTVDEVKDIRDKAEAMRAYARLAKDTQLEIDAAQYRIRAERRLGEMMAAQPKARPGPKPEIGFSDNPISLREAGIDKSLANRARKMASIPEEAFESLLANVCERLSNRQRVSLDIAAMDKKERRAVRERLLGGIQCALPTQKFGVILADPEWRFEPWSRETGMDRAVDNHYPTSVTEVIAARDVASIAADDSVLFLWGTVPMLPQAFMVMGAWGFDYRSHFCWIKDRIGTGYWSRNNHELLLVGTRGKIPAPDPTTLSASAFEAPRGEHSAKPECVLEMIERWFPTLPKIELNARKARPGWVAWGNEAPPAILPELTELEILDRNGPAVDPDGAAVRENVAPPAVVEAGLVSASPGNAAPEIAACLKRGHPEGLVKTGGRDG
jgi:N6-adenosine-specific RNA methylase IME4